MHNLMRILDANANRAREAMRVMEEYARFILNDRSLSTELKTLRHECRAAIDESTFPPGLFEANRDTPNDVGTQITTASEQHRYQPADVIIAAGKRLTEALRVLEEYGKLHDPDFSKKIEQLRYRAYTIEQQIHKRLSTSTAQQWSLCVILTESLCRLPWTEVLNAAINNGADCIQLREKEIDDRELIKRAEHVVSRCHEKGVTVIINDRPDIALLIGADGVHLGQNDMTIEQARRIAGRSLIVGISTSNIDEANTAWQDSADYCGVGSMFPTQTKRKPETAGPVYLQQYVQTIPIPHLAIGGITPENLPELIAAGVGGIAVCATVCQSNDPAITVRQLRTTLKM